MTSPQQGIRLIIVAHDDAHLSIVQQKEGWGDAYQKKAAVLRLSPADIKKLSLKDSARLELVSPAGSIVINVKMDSTCQEGTGCMAFSLYTNRLAGYDPKSSRLPGTRHIQAQAVPTDKNITPLSDLFVRRDLA